MENIYKENFDSKFECGFTDEVGKIAENIRDELLPIYKKNFEILEKRFGIEQTKKIFEQSLFWCGCKYLCERTGINLEGF